MQHIATQGQSISFCGVNAHFQNGKAERRIRTIQELGRTQLIHAQHKWPAAITTNLWPYALKNVTDILNDSITRKETRTRIEKFTGVDIRPNIRNYHHFGVPTFVLQNELQANKKIGKWLPRARIGIYLCKSPRHARSVSLILNPRTGLVSPQFHIRCDDTFDTVQNEKLEQHGLWQQKCGFILQNSVHATAHTKHTDTSIQLLNDTHTISSFNIPTYIDRNQEHSNIRNTTTDQGIEYEGVIPHSEGASTQVQHTTIINNNDVLATTTSTRTSKRKWKPTSKVLESFQQQDLAFSAISNIENTDTNIESWNESLHYDSYEICITDDINPISIKFLCKNLFQTLPACFCPYKFLISFNTCVPAV